MSVITSSTFISPYPDTCPEWAKEGSLVRCLRIKKSPLLGEYRDMLTYEIVDISWHDPVEGKGIWGVAYLRPVGEQGRWTRAEYLCDLEEATAS